MQTFANSLDNPCLLLTISRVDGAIERVTTASTDITVSATTWTAHPGLTVGSKTSRADGTPPTIGFQAQLQADVPLRFADVINGKHDGARVQIYVVSQHTPTTPDLVFDGLVMGEVTYNQHGVGSFDLISIFAPPRGILIEKFSLMCRWNFGQSNTCRMRILPEDTFPFNTDHTLHDPPPRNTAIALADARRYRFGSDGTPEDFMNVYLEAQVQMGITGAVEPTFSSVVDDLVTDGTQIWQTVNAYARAARIASVDRHRITLDRLPDPRATGDSTWFQPLKFVFRSGEYTERAFKGSGWDTATLSFETYLPCALAAVGDWIEITPDCDKTIAMCGDKFSNTHFFGGFPYQIGAKAQAQQLGLV